MSDYSKHMKHWKNHKKDKYYQQCSGYGGNGKPKQPIDEQILLQVTINCYERIVNEVKPEDFPIYICIHGDGYVGICDEKNFLGTKIENHKELIQFGKDYIY